MDEIEARFALLQQEINHLREGIRAFDTILIQIKGWCVTATVTLIGFSLTAKRPALLGAALVAILAFMLVDAHFKSVQRALINRCGTLEVRLAGQDVLTVLADQHDSPAIARLFVPEDRLWTNFKYESVQLLKEATQPLTYGLYLLLALCLGVSVNRPG